MFRLLLILLLFLSLSFASLAHDQEVAGEEGDGVEAVPEARCDDGRANGFACFNVDLLAWLPTGVFGYGRANDVWGWTDPSSGREYAMIGLRGGTAFVDVTHPTEPLYVGVLPTHTVDSTWRDIKTYRDHAFVVSEARDHGLQIFDLSELAHVDDPPREFAATVHYAGFGGSHNLALNEETGIAFAVGTSTCAGGLHMIDVNSPQEPRFAGCFSADGYTHDTQCVIYRGPDVEHQNSEICLNSNEDTVTIVDVTNKDDPHLLSRQGYAGSTYTHQGWLTEDHRYFLLGDELDERSRRHNTRTYVWDVTDLDAPFVVGSYTSSEFSIDHNLFVVGNHVFEANYLSGLRVLRMGDLSQVELVEVASFDTTPFQSGVTFRGAWGVYPFFESGTVLISDINNGLFILGPELDIVPECADGIDNDLDGLRDHPEDPGCADAEGGSELPRNDVAVLVNARNPRLLVNPFSHGGIFVAVKGSTNFDVNLVDPETLEFGPSRAATLGSTVQKDIDGDGILDLIGKFRASESGLQVGDRSACLGWSTRVGIPYQGCDAIRTISLESKSKSKSK